MSYLILAIDIDGTLFVPDDKIHCKMQKPNRYYRLTDQHLKFIPRENHPRTGLFSTHGRLRFNSAETFEGYSKDGQTEQPTKVIMLRKQVYKNFFLTLSAGQHQVWPCFISRGYYSPFALKMFLKNQFPETGDFFMGSAITVVSNHPDANAYYKPEQFSRRGRDIRQLPPPAIKEKVILSLMEDYGCEEAVWIDDDYKDIYHPDKVKYINPLEFDGGDQAAADMFYSHTLNTAIAKYKMPSSDR